MTKNNEISKLKILIAEDDESSDSLITESIKHLCREILHVDNGIDAVEVSRNNPDLDLIFMDIKMPDLNGLEATRQIRTFNSDVIIIAQTAFAGDADKAKILAIGCNKYITKPINIRQLVAMTEEILDSKNNGS